MNSLSLWMTQPVHGCSDHALPPSLQGNVNMPGLTYLASKHVNTVAGFRLFPIKGHREPHRGYKESLNLDGADCVRRADGTGRRARCCMADMVSPPEM